ncbi:MAG: hypothetical protein LQ349_003154 [Xanthoria aureola]|nr:MAG: hypothetical protein LQ349_003154 [Xanthoria aureola]
MNKDLGYLVPAEKYNAIIQAVAYVHMERCPRLTPLHPLAHRTSQQKSPHSQPPSTDPVNLSSFITPFFTTLERTLTGFVSSLITSSALKNKQKSHSSTHPNRKNMPTAMLPSPPPTAPLPALPLEAPPATPRNASHLYGEFSWPSLDICTLLEKLEDVVAEKDEEEEGEEEEQYLPSDNNDFADALIARYGPEDDSVPSQQKVFSDILTLLEMQVRICDWIDEVSDDYEDYEEHESMYFTASNDDDDDDDDDDEFMDGKTDVDVGVGVIHDDEWVDDEDREDMGELLGWFDGFGEGVQSQMVVVNGRRGRERRVGCIFA